MTRPGFDEAVEAAAKADYEAYRTAFNALRVEGVPVLTANDWANVSDRVRRSRRDQCRGFIEAAYPVILEAAAAEIERAIKENAARLWALHWPTGMTAAARIVRGLAAEDPVKQGETT